jgi:citrate synthase
VTDTPPNKEWLRSSIGASTSESISLRGRDLASEVMGQMTFSDVAYLLAAGRPPTSDESTLFNAVLVALADHGLTPTALAARLTYTGAPEAIQGAIAAGLLGGGSVFLGPVEDTARFLAAILAGMPEERAADESALKEAAAGAVREAVAAGQRIPGLGHPIHKDTDPRTPVLYDLAAKTGLAGPHLRLLQLVALEHRTATGKALPINGAGAAGAALRDLGFPPAIARGFALLARTAGLVGHLAEEAEHPIGMRLWQEVESRSSVSRGPASDETP